MLVALGVDGEVHHHDTVLLDDADQQDDADHGDQAEIVAEQHQRRDRAGTGRGQRRQDRQRVDVALVEDAEDQVDDEQRREDQHRHGLQRLLECLGVALEGADQRRRHLHLALRSAGLPRSPCRATRPGARLKLMVTAGNCPWWLIDSGSVLRVVHLAKAASGTCWPVVGERM